MTDQRIVMGDSLRGRGLRCIRRGYPPYICAVKRIAFDEVDEAAVRRPYGMVRR